uniref:DUF834 domain-containing protein n=1 Tax=Oryza meridionalis TaxID=40149 RepID=A0A0E0CIR4_9ORYZ
MGATSTAEMLSTSSFSSCWKEEHAAEAAAARPAAPEVERRSIACCRHRGERRLAGGVGEATRSPSKESEAGANHCVEQSGMARWSGNKDGRWSTAVADAEVVGEEGEDRVEVGADAGGALGALPGRRCGGGRFRP